MQDHNSIFIGIKNNLTIKKLRETNQGFNVLESSFSKSENVRAPFQLREERYSMYLKRLFPSRNNSSIFKSLAPVTQKVK